MVSSARLGWTQRPIGVRVRGLHRIEPPTRTYIKVFHEYDGSFKRETLVLGTDACIKLRLRVPGAAN